MSARTFLPQFGVTQRIVAVKLPGNTTHTLTGVVTSGQMITIQPVSLRILSHGDTYQVEGTGPKVNADGELSPTWRTVVTHSTGLNLPQCPEWVMGILDVVTQ